MSSSAEETDAGLSLWLIVVATLVYHILGGWFLFHKFNQRALDNYGLDIELAQPIALAIGLVALESLPSFVYFLGKGRQKRKAYASAMLFVGANSFLMLTVGREACFDSSSRPLKWFLDTPEGRIYKSMSRADPRTGESLRQYTVDQARADGPMHACRAGWMSPESSRLRGVEQAGTPRDLTGNSGPASRDSATAPVSASPPTPGSDSVVALEAADGLSTDVAALARFLPANAVDSAAAVRITRISDFPIRVGPSFGDAVVKRLSTAESVYVIGASRSGPSTVPGDQSSIGVVVRPTMVRASQGQAPATVGSAVVVISNGPTGPHVSTSVDGHELIGEIPADAIEMLKGPDEQWIRVLASAKAVGFIPVRFLRRP
jgi:hypothetical protein